MRYHKRSRGDKRVNVATCPVCRGTGGHYLFPTLSAFPSSTYGPRASRLRSATPKLERGWDGQRRPVGPGSGPRGKLRWIADAGGEGARRPSPRRGLGAPNGGAAGPAARARRPLPARPVALGHTPRSRGGPPADWLGPPEQRSSGGPPARACGLVGVT